MLCFKIVGFCSKLMVLFFPQLYSICSKILLRLCNYALCDDDLIGAGFIGIVNNKINCKMILFGSMLTLLLCNNVL